MLGKATPLVGHRTVVMRQDTAIRLHMYPIQRTVRVPRTVVRQGIIIISLRRTRVDRRNTTLGQGTAPAPVFTNIPIMTRSLDPGTVPVLVGTMRTMVIDEEAGRRMIRWAERWAEGMVRVPDRVEHTAMGRGRARQAGVGMVKI
jgi:hypothetical protein